jgi:hypothetical protein
MRTRLISEVPDCSVHSIKNGSSYDRQHECRVIMSSRCIRHQMLNGVTKTLDWIVNAVLAN